VTAYRVYQLDHLGRIRGPATIVDEIYDDAAMLVASELTPLGSVSEVWRGGILIGTTHGSAETVVTPFLRGSGALHGTASCLGLNEAAPHHVPAGAVAHNVHQLARPRRAGSANAAATATFVSAEPRPHDLQGYIGQGRCTS
jgi:hypothetical protein